jgi:hypothetical protein
MNPAPDVISVVLDSINEAGTAFDNFINAHGDRNSDYRDEQEGIVGHFIECAFLQLRLFLEAKQLPHMLGELLVDHKKARANFMKSEMSSWGEPYSFWTGRLRQYVSAIYATFGATSSSTVTKDLIEILRATIYSITDQDCFGHPPGREADVHNRIEAVLRCVFPTLVHKPPIAKPIKNFEPDTGLPTVNTLVEYKFVSTKEEVKRVADEVLADTRGYTSKDWNRFIFVIYETKRLKSEIQWAELMKASGVGEDTQVIVISGEDPLSKAGSRNTGAKNKSHRRRQPTQAS